MIEIFCLFLFIDCIVPSPTGIYAKRPMHVKTDPKKFIVETKDIPIDEDSPSNFLVQTNADITGEHSMRGSSSDYSLPSYHGSSQCQQCGVEYQCGNDYIFNGEATKVCLYFQL